jgi:hypothetical protein
MTHEGRHHLIQCVTQSPLTPQKKGKVIFLVVLSSDRDRKDSRLPLREQPETRGDLGIVAKEFAHQTTITG